MNMKKLTDTQIAEASKKYGIDIPSLRAIIEVECRNSGFNLDGTPVILFERHVMRERLIVNNKYGVVLKMEKERPDLCNKYSGGYGLYSAQHGRLNSAAKYHRASALESASWGLGQVMGYHWNDLGYNSLQSFINAMYKDEASQLDAMCKFIEKNKLVEVIKQKKWSEFALKYNGKAYKKNKYDEKLESAYNTWNEKNLNKHS